MAAKDRSVKTRLRMLVRSARLQTLQFRLPVATQGVIMSLRTSRVGFGRSVRASWVGVRFAVVSLAVVAAGNYGIAHSGVVDIVMRCTSRPVKPVLAGTLFAEDAYDVAVLRIHVHSQVAERLHELFAV